MDEEAVKQAACQCSCWFVKNYDERCSYVPGCHQGAAPGFYSHKEDEKNFFSLHISRIPTLAYCGK